MSTAICFFSFQAIPVALSGRDIIGIAKTGSGKTAAFLWPALVHIMDQPELEPGDGPIALICAPTRELCQQIFIEARRFGKVYNIHAVAVFGGGNKYEQSKALQEGAEIVVATPVRKQSFCYYSVEWGEGMILQASCLLDSRVPPYPWDLMSDYFDTKLVLKGLQLFANCNIVLLKHLTLSSLGTFDRSCEGKEHKSSKGDVPGI